MPDDEAGFPNFNNNGVVSKQYGWRTGLPNTVCPPDYLCRNLPSSAQRVIGSGFCKRKVVVQVSERCSVSIACVEKDNEGRLIVCAGGFGVTKCSNRLEDGESCAADSGLCGYSDDRLNSGSCVRANVCRLTEDRTCKEDADCDATAGVSCVRVPNLQNAGSKTCYNYTLVSLKRALLKQHFFLLCVV